MSGIPVKHRTIVLGAGHAGGRAAEALRQADPERDIVVIGRERHPPYERPPVSKALLAGTAEAASAYLDPIDRYGERGIELRLGCEVECVDRSTQRLVLADGERVAYDTLILATGARPRRLAVPGANGARLVYLRDIDDALALRERLVPGIHLAVIGAGFIGLEVAAVARARGCAVTVIETAPHALGRVVPQEIGDYMTALHRSRGVELRFTTSVAAVEESDTMIRLVTAAGDAITADVAVVGIGAVPNIELAAEAGLAVDDGVLVDAFGRTDDPQIFAVGDVTRHYNPLLGRRLRLESWQNAQNQAIAVARVVAGSDQPYAEVPWFWTDQHEVNLQIAGAPTPGEVVELVRRGKPKDGRFTVFQLDRDGRVVGGATVNNGRDMRFVKQLIANNQRPPERAALADPAVKLMEVCRA
jgi:3-phenylpropionate/trans-cinnamate dioxygenase ferredoxin reductase subunit